MLSFDRHKSYVIEEEQRLLFTFYKDIEAQKFKNGPKCTQLVKVDLDPGLGLSNC